MSLRFCDSFDGYDTPYLFTKWTGFVATVTDVTITSSSPRTGIQCAAITRNGMFKTVDNLTTWIVGGAFNWEAFGGGVAIDHVQQTDNQIRWELQGDGTLKIINGTGGTLGTTNPVLAISLSNYYYIEMQTTIGSAGSVEIRINGQNVFSTSGVRTNNGGSNTIGDVVRVFGPGGASIMRVDDFYVLDTNTVDQAGQTTTNTTFLGDVQIARILPNAEGDLLQWVTSTGTVHFSLVNEVPPDGDTTYVQSTFSGTGPIDLYNFEDIPTNRTILGVQSNIFARKTDEGNRAISVVTSNSSTISVTDTSGRYLNLTYLDFLNQFDVNPVNGTAWDPTTINAGQWGVKVIV